MIREGERVDDLQLAGLRILQKDSGFRFGMDAVLLADFARVEERDRCADFGTGTGILPLRKHGFSDGFMKIRKDLRRRIFRRWFG